ncbi:MAG TPA: peptidase U34 [Candidatus Hydrogenedentes bacterium]|nr:peptidase U34 [Candidatus Hydrogenedentota bacterium]
MCDTVAIVGKDRVLFAKNSDRDPNEAQAPEWHPRRRHAPGAMLRCTWMAIPQAAETRAVLLSRPFWMWGAEMGANEDGVAIGNEAVFTRQPYAASGLTGMDLVRLGLERARSADEACGVITALLEAHGQGGGCGHENRRFTYHNSFLIADPSGAFVLETAGREWAVERVTGVRAISNGLSIPAFAARHADRLRTAVSACRARRSRVTALADGVRDAAGLFSILRDHGEGARYPRYSVINGGMAAPCMHAGGLVAASQTTASWVSELRGDGCRHWITATAAPCVSLFKPVAVEDPLDLGPFPTDRADTSLWWRHERLHRAAMRDPEAAFAVFQEERGALEREWSHAPPDSRAAFAEHDRLLEQWTDRVIAACRRDARPAFVRGYWRKRSRRAAIPSGDLRFGGLRG